VIVQTHEFLRQLSVLSSAEELLMIIEKEVLEELKKPPKNASSCLGQGECPSSGSPLKAMAKEVP